MVDKCFSVLTKCITERLLGNLMKNTPTTSSENVQVPTGISRGFDLFVGSVRQSRNKYEEQRTVTRELQLLQSNMPELDICSVQMRDYLSRMIFCHTLNYDVSFGLIHALKLVSNFRTMSDRRFGYLACTLLLHRDSELSLLLICNIQSDLTSRNMLRNMMALSCASQILPAFAFQHIFHAVIDNLRLCRGPVRQKAVLCLNQIQLLIPDLLEDYHDILQKTILDKDPGVMAAAVHIIQFYIERDAENCLRFGESLMLILKQINSGKMPSTYEYHNVPFPWLQIQILKCLTKLALKHESLLEKYIPVLNEILQRTSVKENVTFCILYECVQSIVTIQSPKYLLDEAAEHIRKFLQSSSPNLKYIGIKLLVMLVKVNPQYSINYQQLIVKSLENPDVGIQRKMHRLLYEIANESNIIVVCTKLLDQLKSSADKFWRSEVISMVISLIQRFQTDTHWQADSLFDVLMNGDDVISDKLLNQIFCFIESRFLSSETDVAHQKILVTKCVGVLVNRKTPINTIHVALWTLGELCPLLRSMPDDRIIFLVTQHFMNESLTYDVHSCAVTTLQQFVYKGIVEMVTMAIRLKDCLDMKLPMILRQQLSDLIEVCEMGIDLSFRDDSDNSMDLALTFLDELVVKDLKNRSMSFVPVHLQGNKQGISSVTQEDSSSTCPRTGSSTSSTKTTEDIELGLNIPVAKWVCEKQGWLSISALKQDEASVSKQKTSEEDTKEKELATALFGGFLDKESD